jgi:hypothetical protein
MLSNRLAVVIIGGACVMAAGTGAYLASRQNSAPALQAAAAPGDAPEVIHETEAVMETPAAVETTEMASNEPIAEPAPARPEPVVRRAQRRSQSSGARHTSAGATSPAQRTTSDDGTGRDRVDSRPSAQPQPATSGNAEIPPQPAEIIAERAEPAPPPAPRFEELVVPADSVVGLQIENTISSEHAQVEDRVEARVTRDVTVGGRVAIPSGARALGSVALVERGGKIKERARLGVRFHTLVLADGSTLPLQTETLFREGDSPANSSAAKIGGGAIGGAIVGAILGGGKGAVIGGSAGAAGGTAATMAGRRKAATLPSGSTVTVRVLSPVTVTVER